MFAAIKEGVKPLDAFFWMPGRGYLVAECYSANTLMDISGNITLLIW